MKTLTIRSNEGNYNFCNSQEISTSCHIEYKDSEETTRKYINLNIKDEYGIYIPNDGFLSVEEAEDMIEQWDKKIWISSSKEDNKKFLKFIKKEEKHIERGNMLAQLDLAYKKKDATEYEIKQLEELLKQD